MDGLTLDGNSVPHGRQPHPKSLAIVAVRSADFAEDVSVLLLQLPV